MTVDQTTFTQIANAIRSKTGKSDTMKITEMPGEIRSIIAQPKGTLVVTLSDVAVGVTVTATKQLQSPPASQTISFTQVTDSTGVATITVDAGYDYVISADGYTSSSSTHVDVGTVNVTLQKEQSGYGFAQVDIQISNSDPSQRCSYPETITVNGETVNNSCYNFTPQKSATDSFDMGDWATHMILSGIKPVSSDGQATPTFTDADVDASTWTTGTEYFTEFPFNWLSITNDGTNIRIIFSDNDTQPDSTFQCYAHAKQCDTAVCSDSQDDITDAMQNVSRSSIMSDNQNQFFANSFHVGCFDANGGSSGQQIYSKAGTTQTTSVQYAYYFQGANARGDEYDCMSYQQYTYLQQIFVLLYKSTNCQTAHSQGLGKVASESVSTNTTNQPLQTTQYGMQGSVGVAQRNAFFWIHDLWGNINQFVGGLWNRAQSTKYLYAWFPRQANSRQFNNGWTQQTTYATQQGMGKQQITTASSASGGFINTVAGNNLAGFAPMTTSGGSQSTYFPDVGNVYANASIATFPYVGGYAANSAGRVGLFSCYVSNYSTSSYSSCGSRLSYRGGRT